MKDRIRTVRQAVKGEERPDVLYLFYGYTAGRGTFIEEIIRTAGGNNVAAEAGISGYKQISKEVVVKQNPEWIVLNDNDLPFRTVRDTKISPPFGRTRLS
jgi:iron complex transport system substrate-binding protein